MSKLSCRDMLIHLMYKLPENELEKLLTGGSVCSASDAGFVIVNLQKPQLRMVKLLYLLFVIYKLLHHNSSIQYQIDLQDD